MNISIQPSVDEVASERLHAFAMQLADARFSGGVIHKLVDSESGWARRTKLLNGQTHSYEAAIRLLGDLRLLKWTVRADACGIELESPPNPLLKASSPDQIRAAKNEIRTELSHSLAQQFGDPVVREFIRNIEEPSPSSRRRGIGALVADGEEVFAQIQPALFRPPAERPDALASAVQPYLQLLPGEGDPAVLDEFTRIPLGEIWRYFRYTWSIPQTAIPGRQMFYLIRDRAHPCHAVIGIAALGNSPLVCPLRDKAIG